MREIDLNIERAFTYHTPHGTQAERYAALRDKAKELAYLIRELCPASPERTLATRKIEEASMWANASIARNEVQFSAPQPIGG